MNKMSITPLIFLIVLFFHFSSFAQTIEENTDRPGMNLRAFDLIRPLPNLCQQACEDDPNCMAWTYVKPNVQGPNARCWLKTGVPAVVKNPCCISGVKVLRINPSIVPKAVDQPTYNPISPSIQVLFPSKNSVLTAGQMITIKWQMNKNLVKTSAVFKIDLLDSKQKLIMELTNPGGISLAKNLPIYQFNRQIPLTIPGGKYMIRIGLVGQSGINGESGLFDIQYVMHLDGGLGTTPDKPFFSPSASPPPKILDMKVISMNPVISAKKVTSIPIVMEVTTDNQFKLGEFTSNPKDPVNYSILRPKIRLVMTLFPIKKAVNNELSVVDYELLPNSPFLSYPKNVMMNKGKNIIKFNIIIHPSMENPSGGLDPAWWGPLTVHGTYNNYNCLQNVDLRIQTQIYFKSINGPEMGILKQVDVTGPRDDIEAKTGNLFFKFFDLNCN